MIGQSPAAMRGSRWMGAAAGLLYVFLYAPILYVIYTSFSDDIVWPFPPFSRCRPMPTSSQLALWRCALEQPPDRPGQRRALDAARRRPAPSACCAIRSRWRGAVLFVFLAPLFVAELLIGISSLAFNARVLGLPGNLFSAIAANAVQGTAFAFLIILAQLVRYDWHMDDAAMVFGATPAALLLRDHLADDLAVPPRRLPDQLHPGLQQSRDLVLQSRRHTDLAVGRLGVAAFRPGPGALRAGDARQRRSSSSSSR